MARSLYYPIPMRRQTVIQQVVKAALCFSATALFVAVAFPHHHDASTHRQESCRACKIQDGFSAAKPARVVVALRPVPVVFAQLPTLEAPRLGVVDRLHTPRAPPVAS